MLADAGDYAAAWKLFKDVQRQDPDNPSLAHLEVVLLASQGEREQVESRARFWAARLRRLGREGERFVDFMDEVARDPDMLIGQLTGGPDDEGEVSAEDAQAFFDLVGQLPAPAAHYRLSAAEGDAGPLQADTVLAGLDDEWREVYRGGRTEAELPLLEWLVLALNPNDNSGHRVTLVHRLCESGRAGEALAVCERYGEDDFGGMQYGRVLALQQLGRRGEATAALAAAKKNSPKILKTLLASKPKMPDITPGMVTYGGEDEAWLYRTGWLYVWEKTGALAWLRQVADGRPAFN